MYWWWRGQPGTVSAEIQFDHQMKQDVGLFRHGYHNEWWAAGFEVYGPWRRRWMNWLNEGCRLSDGAAAGSGGELWLLNKLCRVRGAFINMK